jgi:hypothetical protein
MNLPHSSLDAHALEVAAFMMDYPPADPYLEVGPPEGWPGWTDAFTWEPGPDPEDERWAASQQLADQTEDRAATREAWLQADRDEALEAMRRADVPADFENR